MSMYGDAMGYTTSGNTIQSGPTLDELVVISRSLRHSRPPVRKIITDDAEAASALLTRHVDATTRLWAGETE